MKTYALTAIVSATACTMLLTTACQSPRQDTGIRRTAKAAAVPMVGKAIQSALEVARDANAQIEFFTADNEPTDKFSEGAAGSVSVHAPGGGGQDNYAFNAAGVITRHQRSFGKDYDAGVWTDAP